MKATYRVGIILSVIAVLAAPLPCQSPPDHKASALWSVQLEAGAGNSGGEGTLEYGAAISREIRHWLDIGAAVRGLSRIDHGMKDNLSREYHMETAYAALRLRPKMEPVPGVELAMPLEMGSGMLTYRYEHEYAEDMRWSEEILDQLNYAVYSAGIESLFRLVRHYSLVIRGGYRITSPIRTDLAETDELSGFWSDLGVSYRF
jgi:hypothetical protein